MASQFGIAALALTPNGTYTHSYLCVRYVAADTKVQDLRIGYEYVAALMLHAAAALSVDHVWIGEV